MSLTELKRLKQLEQENKRLKQMYATLSMDNDLLKEVLEKKLGVDLDDELSQESQLTRKGFRSHKLAALQASIVKPIDMIQSKTRKMR